MGSSPSGDHRKMLKPRLLGKDPFATEQHIMDIRDVPGRAWMVENALWDIIGRWQTSLSIRCGEGFRTGAGLMPPRENSHP